MPRNSFIWCKCINAKSRGFLVVNILKTSKAMEFVRQVHTNYMTFLKIKKQRRTKSTILGTPKNIHPMK